MHFYPTPATLDGHPGELLERDGPSGCWQGELDGESLATLLRSSAEGARVLYRDAHGEARAVVRRCWYDVRSGRVRALFAIVTADA